jgi:hypothetical protein
MGKVFVIDDHKTSKKPLAASRRPAPADRSPKPKKNGGPNAWRRVLASYLVGPISVAFWVKGPGRTTWAVTGVACIAVAIILLTRGSSMADSLLAGGYGVLSWIVVVPLLILALATVWTLAIDRAGRGKAVPVSWYPGWIRGAWAVFWCGMVVPGMGLRIAGHRRAAARAFWLVGPLAAAGVILANSHRLWDRSRLDVPPGIAGPALETVFIAAAVVVVVSLLAWLVQALDGSRRVSNRRAVGTSNAVSVALLLSLVLGALMFRPIDVAGNLDTASTALRRDGFQLIPLKLSLAAARLHPEQPLYVARAAEIAEALGMNELAREKRRILEQRMEAYVDIVERERNVEEAAAAARLRASIGIDVDNYLHEFDGPGYWGDQKTRPEEKQIQRR